MDNDNQYEITLEAYQLSKWIKEKDFMHFEESLKQGVKVNNLNAIPSFMEDFLSLEPQDRLKVAQLLQQYKYDFNVFSNRIYILLEQGDQEMVRFLATKIGLIGKPHNKLLLNAIEKGYQDLAIDIVKAYKEYDDDKELLFVKTDNGQTAGYLAIKQGFFSLFDEILKAEPTLINQMTLDDEGYRSDLIAQSILNGKVDFLNACINYYEKLHSADSTTEIKNDDNQSLSDGNIIALYFDGMNDDVTEETAIQMLELLYQHREKLGITDFSPVLRMGVAYEMYSLMDKAIEYGADVNALDYDGSSIIEYIHDDNVQMLKRLVDLGYDVAGDLDASKAVLEWAVESDSVEIATYLVDNYGLDIHQKDKNGNPLTMNAVESFSFNTLKFLDEKGVPLVVSSDNLSPVQVLDNAFKNDDYVDTRDFDEMLANYYQMRAWLENKPYLMEREDKVESIQEAGADSQQQSDEKNKPDSNKELIKENYSTQVTPQPTRKLVAKHNGNGILPSVVGHVLSLFGREPRQ